MDQKKQDYVYIEEDVLNSGISFNAKLLYIYLRKKADDHNICKKITMEKIEEDINITRKTVSALIKELTKISFIETECRGMNQHNIYRLRSGTNRTVKVEMSLITDERLSKSEKVLYLIINYSSKPISREEILMGNWISASALKKAIGTLKSLDLISEDVSGKKYYYWGTSRKAPTVDRSEIEKWLGEDYFVRNTGIFADAAAIIRDTIIKDDSKLRKNAPPLFSIYCHEYIDPEKIISAFINDRKYPNCDSFLRGMAVGESFKGFYRNNSDKEPEKKNKALKDTSLNYFVEHEKMMLYAKVTKTAGDHYIMSNLSDNGEFQTDKNEITLKKGCCYRVFLMCSNDQDDKYHLLYAEKCRSDVFKRYVINKDGCKYEDRDFCTISSSKNKKNGEITVKGLAFIRRNNLLLPFMTAMMIDGSFPKDYPKTEKGVIMNFRGEVVSVHKKGTIIKASSIRFVTRTVESRAAFLEHILGIKKEISAKLVEDGFPELSEDLYDSAYITEFFEKEGIDPQNAKRLTDRCTMIFRPGDLLKTLNAGFDSKGSDTAIQCFDRLYKEYCFDALSEFHKNPYLINNITEDATLNACDRIAVSLGIKYDDSVRIRALIKHIFMLSSENGNIGMPVNEIIEKAARFRSFDRTPEKDKIIKEISNLDDLVYLEGSDTVADRILYGHEDIIVKELKRISQAESVPLCFDREKTDRLLEELGKSISEDKYPAIENVSKSNVSILTGGAGTGKSTVIETIVGMCNKYAKKLKIAICAPTGKAASNLKLSGKNKGLTVHSLMRITPSETEAINKKIDADIIILDEASMLDIKLAASFFSSIRSGARLVLVGDKNQLPPVEAGQVFCDIMESGCFACCMLNEIHRQAGGSSIIDNSLKIIDGRSDLVCDDSFRMIRCDSDDQIRETLIDEFQKVFDKAKPFETQVIVPYKNGRDGLYALNSELQMAVNPCSESINAGRLHYSVGDKLVFNRSKYTIIDKRSKKDNRKNNIKNGKRRVALFINGQTGVVSSIDHKPMTVNVNISREKDKKKIVKLTFSNIVSEDFSLAYAMTVHKSQGSQFEDVFIVLPDKKGNFVSRRLFYTAVTRAKKRITVIYSNDEVNKAISREESRLTFLKEKLSAEFDS